MSVGSVAVIGETVIVHWCQERRVWFAMARSRVLERDEKDPGLLFRMSAASRVCFLRSGLILAGLKEAAIWPKVREEFMRLVRNGRMLLEVAWRRDRVKVALLDVTILWTSSEEREIKWVKTGVYRER